MLLQIAKLSHFGGIHLKHTIKKILDYMMTTTLQCQFNWAGKPGWKGNGVARRGFQHCQLCLVIAGQCHCPLFCQFI